MKSEAKKTNKAECIELSFTKLCESVMSLGTIITMMIKGGEDKEKKKREMIIRPIGELIGQLPNNLNGITEEIHSMREILDTNFLKEKEKVEVVKGKEIDRKSEDRSETIDASLNNLRGSVESLDTTVREMTIGTEGEEALSKTAKRSIGVLIGQLPDNLNDITKIVNNIREALVKDFL